MRAGILAIVLAAAVGCDSQSGGTRIHPTEENRSEDFLRASDDTALHALKDSLEGAVEIGRVGKETGEDHEIFGLVEDAAFVSDDSVAVLDGRFNEVRIYGEGLELIGVFGGPGQGPIEFQSPEALVAHEDGTIVVADRSNQLKVFRVRDGEYVRDATITVELVPEDLCANRHGHYLAGVKDPDGVIHRVGLAEERILDSFAPLYQDEGWLERNQLSDGPFSCGEGTTLFARTHFPELYALSNPEGETMWAKRLTAFEIGAIESTSDEEGRPGVSFSLPSTDARDVVLNIVHLGDDVFLVQVARYTRASLTRDRSHESLRSVLVNREGEFVPVERDLPLILDRRGERLLLARNEPYPELLLYRLESLE